MSREYTVQRGDSLTSVCREQLGNETLLWTVARRNRLPHPYPLYIGQTLRLPDRRGDARPLARGDHDRRNASAIARHAVEELGFPAFSFNLLRKARAFTIDVGAASVTIQPIGTLTVKRAGVLSNFSVSDLRSISTSASAEASAAVDDFTSTLSQSIGVSYTPGEERLSVNMSLSGSISYEGQTLLRVRLRPAGPLTMEATIRPAPIRATVAEHTITGDYGVKITVQLRPLPPQQERPLGDRVRDFVRVASGVGLVISAGAIVVGTLVEDVATLGVGVADDPASFAAAAAAFGLTIELFEGGEAEASESEL